MISGFELKDVEKFKKECISGLRKILNQPGLQFMAKSSGRRETFQVRLPQDQIPFDGAMPLLRLHEGAFQSYWLAVNVDIERPPRKVFLTHVSLQIYMGEFTDLAKRQWMRAEWDARSGGIPKPHAQPHWQIHLDQVDTFVDPGSLEELSGDLALGQERQFELGTADETAATLQESAGRGRVGRALLALNAFHYAMAAEWHTARPKDAWRVPSEASDVARWMERCISYVIAQLQYCEVKLPAA